MKKRRIVKMFILEIVTLGIYRLYWLFKTRKELMARTSMKIPSVWFLCLPILLVVAVSGFVLVSSGNNTSAMFASDKCMQDQGYSSSSTSYTYSSDTAAKKEAQKQCDKENGVSTTAPILLNILVFVAIFLYLPLFAWWFWEYSKAVEKVTDEKLSRALGMLLFLAVPDGLDILIVQDYFNKVPEAQGVPAA